MDIELTKVSATGYDGCYDQSFDPAISIWERKLM